MDTLELVTRRAARIRIKALSLSRDMKSGSFRSLYRGQGIEFAGVREYLPGDDVRAIDWNVTARMGKPFIKQFQEERELAVFIALDCSRSVETSSFHEVRDTASLAALAGNFGGCPVGAVVFSGEHLFSCAPRRGVRHVMTLLSRFDALTSRRGAASESCAGTALANALYGAAKLLRSRSLVFVISDFRVAQWERPFARLAAKHDVIALRITGGLDELPFAARMTFTDPETGLTQSLPAHSERFRREWKKDRETREARWFESVTSQGGYPLVIREGEDPFVVLSRFFSTRGES
jgi:uncharacterized protein (DUF58 family)